MGKFFFKLFILLAMVYVFFNGVDIMLPMAKADTAVLQLQNSDQAYVAFQAVNNTKEITIKSIGTIILVGFVYFSEIKTLFNKNKKQGDK